MCAQGHSKRQEYLRREGESESAREPSSRKSCHQIAGGSKPNAPKNGRMETGTSTIRAEHSTIVDSMSGDRGAAAAAGLMLQISRCN